MNSQHLIHIMIYSITASLLPIVVIASTAQVVGGGPAMEKCDAAPNTDVDHGAEVVLLQAGLKLQSTPTLSPTNSSTNYEYVFFGHGACRGTNQSNLAGTWYYVVDNFSGDHTDCMAICNADSNCTAFEFNYNDHCEIWTTEPQATSARYWFIACFKKVPASTLRLDALQNPPRDPARELPIVQKHYDYLLFGLGACQGPGTVIANIFRTWECRKLCDLDDNCKAMSVQSGGQGEPKLCKLFWAEVQGTDETKRSVPCLKKIPAVLEPAIFGRTPSNPGSYAGLY